MRKAIAVLTIAVLGLSMVAGIASARVSNKAKAVAVVKEAVGERYIQFEVGPPSYVNVSGAHISVSCAQLSGSKFKCTWSARNRLQEHATGGATVTLYGKGGTARLTNVRCEKLYGHCY